MPKPFAILLVGAVLANGCRDPWKMLPHPGANLQFHQNPALGPGAEAQHVDLVMRPMGQPNRQGIFFTAGHSR